MGVREDVRVENLSGDEYNNSEQTRTNKDIIKEWRDTVKQTNYMASLLNGYAEDGVVNLTRLERLVKICTDLEDLQWEMYYEVNPRE